MKKILILTLDWLTDRFNDYNSDFKKNGGI
jgi:hypothetical protein